MPETPSPIIVIVGPTASGKSELAIALAKEIGGEIISADSRQVFRGMDIGTGKVPRDRITSYELRVTRKKNEDTRSNDAPTRKPMNPFTPYYSESIPHYLIDVAHPKADYNVSHFLRDSAAAIADIRARGKRVILCGGTTFWIEALVFGLTLPQVKPDKEFREKWGTKDSGELYGYLKRLDPERAKNIDRRNTVRLLRAIEIAKALGKVPTLRSDSKCSITHFQFLGLNPAVEILNEHIRTRLKLRMRQGMVREVEKLHASGVSWKRLESFGLEYRAVARYLQGHMTRKELESTLPYDIIHYAKRQRSSLRRLEKRGVKITWYESKETALANFRPQDI